MSNHKDEQTTKQKRLIDRMDERATLDQVIAEEEVQTKRTKAELRQLKREFNDAQRNVTWLKKVLRGSVRFLRSMAAYALGRRNLKQLYSESYKLKKAANTLKPYLYNLYNLGFREKGLADLTALAAETTDRYLKRAIAWELTLWHANQYTTDGAEQALGYLHMAMNSIKDPEQRRKAAIIKAECLERLDRHVEARQVIDAVLRTQQHPDMYLAAANLEERLTDRIAFINKALDMYAIHPITFRHIEQEEVIYDDLMTEPTMEQVKTGPLVSVIFPAYNSETGIGTAIDSILAQTWKNLELLVVDDCSTDQTATVIKEYAQRDDRITFYSTPVNSGPYVARNIALAAATGEYVTINDADDWSHPEKIATQVRHLEENEAIIANTSEHSRLTEDLKLYRRGTPGLYIFSNMSSLLFRREPVMEKLGYWDSVRFAADGEFKRRLLKEFGKDKIVDLQTGPLSLPRQTVTSLTGSSAFGYNGFFMGVRKEYVESLSYHHEQTRSAYYPFPEQERPFPVPEPMWPQREAKPIEGRHFDVVIAADFRGEGKTHLLTIEEMKVHKEMGLRTGLVQISCYNRERHQKTNGAIREHIDGDDIQMLVYGERIVCDLLIVKDPSILTDRQTYIPTITPTMITVVVDQPPEQLAFRQYNERLVEYFGRRGKWYPQDSQVRDRLQADFHRQLRSVKLASEDWTDGNGVNHEQYKTRLNEWIF